MESKPKAKLHYLFLNMFLPLITIAMVSGGVLAIIQQQTHSSEQMLIMLKQIASGVEKFAHTTASISGASENIQSIATVLNK